jgi:hypothetical protein
MEVVNLKERGHSEVLDVDRKIIFRKFMIRIIASRTAPGPPCLLSNGYQALFL